MAKKDIKIADATYKSVPKVLMSTPDGGMAEFVETSDATATADNLAKNATAYVNGELVTGVYDGSDKQDKLTFDTTPTADSTNPVTSDGIKDYADTKVDKSGDTMTGVLNVPKINSPKINSTGDKDKREIATGVNESSYFQSRKFRGEGNANAYYHAVDFGYAGHNQVDFHEYGGVWNFLRNQGGKSTTGQSAGSIQYDKGWVGKVNGYDIGMSLPPGSKLTDTVYDDTALSNRVTVLETKINNLIDGNNDIQYMVIHNDYYCPIQCDSGEIIVTNDDDPILVDWKYCISPCECAEEENE